MPLLSIGVHVSPAQVHLLPNCTYRRSPYVTAIGQLITEEIEVIYMNGMTLSQYPGLHRLIMASQSQVIEIGTDEPTFRPRPVAMVDYELYCGIQPSMANLDARRTLTVHNKEAHAVFGPAQEIFGINRPQL
jgi:hypothetical protein